MTTSDDAAREPGHDEIDDLFADLADDFPSDDIVDLPSAGSVDRGPRNPGAPAVSSSVMDSIVKRFRDDDSALPETVNQVTITVTRTYLAALPQSPTILPDASQIEHDLITLVGRAISIQNMKLPKGDTKYSKPRVLTPWQVAQCLLRLHGIIRIAPTKGNYDREYDLLAMYRPDGPMKGTYTTSEDDIRTIARRYHVSISLADVKELFAVLREDAPRVTLSGHRDLVALNNGVFHYGTEDANIETEGGIIHFRAKSLHPFDPRLVFLAKSQVNYVENAPKPVITHPEDGTVWDVESWITDLFIYDTSTASDPAELAEMIEKNQSNAGLDELIWEILGAIIRPHVSWGKTAWFYSEAGNNGKGTLCSLMRNLIGPNSHTSIPLSELGKEFALEPLMSANAIIVDENEVGTFIDKAANLKTIVTNDVIQINRKYRMPVAFQFWGLMVQCLNEMPRVKDKSESFYRRQLFVPFEKSFTGRERKYIKNDYLQRSEVLEYVLWRALHQAGSTRPGDYYEFTEPPATQAVLAAYKEYNDPVRAFWSEFRDQFCWDLLPFTFLYDLYKSWYSRNSPSGSPVSSTQFAKDLCEILRSDTMWHCKDRTAKIRPAQKMNFPEPLIAEYDLKQWMRSGAKPGDPAGLRPDLKPNYRGVLRRPQATAVAAPGADQASDAD